MFFILTMAFLIGAMSALVSYLQYDAAWWKGLLGAALMIGASLGIASWATAPEVAVGDQVILAAGMLIWCGAITALVVVATLVARRRFSERQTVTAAFFGGAALFVIALFGLN
ncbi:hypothetical protein J7382_15900 [Shimia sp. R11_0]|uniref:hypothetical protein n=1 Tax=Shimia sp. R11_0 TaxID=2821096 RepID=UPI001ADC5D79|nr:hypothetical protein [Shimia sp. R11_0]MBO9479032.1 hypothetical protein [Shimia sp. R11_0]